MCNAAAASPNRGRTRERGKRRVSSSNTHRQAVRRRGRHEGTPASIALHVDVDPDVMAGDRAPLGGRADERLVMAMHAILR